MNLKVPDDQVIGAGRPTLSQIINDDKIFEYNNPKETQPMCNFFSFNSDGNGKFFYFDANHRRSEELRNSSLEFDSHTSIATLFLKENHADDKMNKFEFSNGTFKIDQLNVTDDSKLAKEFIREFVKTDAFYDICMEAVKQDGHALNYVPEELRIEALCMEAVKQDGSALCDIPEELRTEALCMEAVKQNGRALNYVPEELKAKIISLLNTSEGE